MSPPWTDAETATVPTSPTPVRRPRMPRPLLALFLLTIPGAARSAPAVKGDAKGDLYYATQEGAKWVYELSAGGRTREVREQVTRVEQKGGAVVVAVSRDLGG